MSRPFGLSVLLLLAFACNAPGVVKDDTGGPDGDADTDTDGDTDTDTDTDADADADTDQTQCAGLAEAVCASEPFCEPIYGYENYCTMPAHGYAGCMSKYHTGAVGCGDAITYAAPDSDPTNCWRFTDTCIPDDFSYCLVDTGC